jgi:hypothetical protein
MSRKSRGTEPSNPWRVAQASGGWALFRCGACGPGMAASGPTLSGSKLRNRQKPTDSPRKQTDRSPRVRLSGGIKSAFPSLVILLALFCLKPTDISLTLIGHLPEHGLRVRVNHHARKAATLGHTITHLLDELLVLHRDQASGPQLAALAGLFTVLLRLILVRLGLTQIA